MKPLLEIRDLRVEFHTFEGTSKVLDGIDLAFGPADTLGLVGETGCGKSITAKSILRLLPTPPARFVTGQILFKGMDVLQASEREIRNMPFLFRTLHLFTRKQGGLIWPSLFSGRH